MSKSKKNSKILINAIEPEECRIAKVNDGKLEEFHFETQANTIQKGNVYKGIVTRVESSLQAVFVDYGEKKYGFLQKKDIHNDYFQHNQGREKSISTLIKRGQEVIVQVTKDSIMKKGAALTTFISLPGRYVVLMPGSKSRSISRQIENEKERTRLKQIFETVKIPEDIGVIIRTAAEKIAKTNIIKDIKSLLKLWEDIQKKAETISTANIIHKTEGLGIRTIRDYLTNDVNEILVDDVGVFKDIKKFLNIIQPKILGIVKLYKGKKPIFSKYEIEKQLVSVFDNKVLLKSGGSIVIEATEALVSIDVNSGKAIQEKNIEATARLTNIEAAEEIARQLKLRDLGGLIVIDFIDMRESKNRLEVENALKKGLSQDKAKTKFIKISKFGLLEMSRQRLKPSYEANFIECKYCKGRGSIQTTETFGLNLLRKVSLKALKADGKDMDIILPFEVAYFILNKKKQEIIDLETRHHIQVNIKIDPYMMPYDSKIILDRDLCT